MWDTLTYKLPTAMTMPDRVRMNTVSLATTALAQTPSFWHAGADLLRSKSLSGTTPGVITMRVDDTVGPNVDPSLKGVVVVFNSTGSTVTQTVPGLAGQSLTLSPVQANGSDAVVRQTTWTTATGTASVPPRTVAVLVQR